MKLCDGWGTLRHVRGRLRSLFCSAEGDEAEEGDYGDERCPEEPGMLFSEGTVVGAGLVCGIWLFRARGDLRCVLLRGEEGGVIVARR